MSGNIVNDKITITYNLNFHQVKTNDPIDDSIFEIIKAADDKSRLRIIKILWNCDTTTKILSEITGLSAGTISIHLKILKDANLVTTRKVGKYVYYQLRKDRFYNLDKKIIRYLSY